jgi:hypothetical protein
VLNDKNQDYFMFFSVDVSRIGDFHVSDLINELYGQY